MTVLVPTARIILFAYNSSFVMHATNSKVGDHAFSLLEGLQSLRKTEVGSLPISYAAEPLFNVR